MLHFLGRMHTKASTCLENKKGANGALFVAEQCPLQACCAVETQHGAVVDDVIDQLREFVRFASHGEAGKRLAIFIIADDAYSACNGTVLIVKNSKE